MSFYVMIFFVSFHKLVVLHNLRVTWVLIFVRTHWCEDDDYV